MDLDAVRALSPNELARYLDALSIPHSWIVHAQVLEAAKEASDEASLPDPVRTPRAGFRNLIVGTIAERVFRDEHLAALEPEGFDVVDYHEAGENRDYGLQRDGLELPINVKVASTLFRNAQTVVHLKPEDCVPISAYKAIGASEREPNLVYVDLVDFTLREKVDAYMNELGGALGVGWHLFSWYGGSGVRSAEDQYLRKLFDAHADSLKELAPAGTQFRVISAKRVLAILRHNPRRVPGLGVRGAGTGGFVAEVNVHVSVGGEMVPWNDLAYELKTHGVQAVLDRIGLEASEIWPNPTI